MVSLTCSLFKGEIHHCLNHTSDEMIAMIGVFPSFAPYSVYLHGLPEWVRYVCHHQAICVGCALSGAVNGVDCVFIMVLLRCITHA